MLDQFRENPPYNVFDKEAVLRFGELEEYLPPTTANTIVGTDNNDELKETQNQILLAGKRGDDTLTGSNKADFLRGDQGNDYLLRS